MEYVHTSLNEEVEFIAASYHLEAENKLPYAGREVLYLVGQTSPICSCCGGSPGFKFITVPGFIVSWQGKVNSEGAAISEIQPVREEKARKEIGAILQREYGISHIDFW